MWMRLLRVMNICLDRDIYLEILFNGENYKKCDFMNGIINFFYFLNIYMQPVMSRGKPLE